MHFVLIAIQRKPDYLNLDLFQEKQRGPIFTGPLL
jgi:hypothetical protein